MAKLNIKSLPSQQFTHGGAPAVRTSAYKALRRALMANMLWENSFYEDGVSIAERIKSLIKQCSFEEAAQAAIDAREKFKLRHVPLLVVRELLRNHGGRKVGDLIERVIQRPDEMGELLALYWADGKDQPLTAQLKIGLARAFKKFNEYALGKYNGDADIKLRDVMFLAHVRPNGADDRYTKKERKGRTKYTLNSHEKLLKAVAENTLKTPDTWETELSAGADKKGTFTRLIREKKLGALALLRNLRGMAEAGVSDDTIRQGLAEMKVDRVLPYRFISAAKYAPRLEDALESAMFRCLEDYPRLPGKTAFLLDHSGSMNDKVSGKSEITRFEAANGLGMLLREVADQAHVFCFSNSTVKVPPRRGFALAEACRESMPFGGTDLRQAVQYVYRQFPDCERLIVLTDEQSSTRPPRPQGLGYIINVAAYQNGIAHGPWVAIDGWSEAVLDYIRELEAE